MALCELTIKSEYRSPIDNVINDFYVPLLTESVLYKRAVGYFSSSTLIEISKGISVFAKKGGKIQIVASPYLSEDDVTAISLGYEKRNDIIQKALLKQLLEPTDYFSSERLNLLAHLIANGIMDIRIAFTEKNNGIGMYHEKMGILDDIHGNRVAFSGSMNESVTAIALNYEAIDVFCSWHNKMELERVRLKERAFESIWNNREPCIRVTEFPEVSEAIVNKYQRKPPNFQIDYEQFIDRTKEVIIVEDDNARNVGIGARVPADISFYDYQEKAISTWVEKSYRGIFDMATGTGKTYTGLGAVSQLSEHLKDQLAVIIVCPFQHLVEQWVEDVVRFNINPIIGYSSSSQKDWKKHLAKAIRDQKLSEDKSFFCLICTNATFASAYVQEQIDKIRSPILLVVDEAHNFGAIGYSKLLDDRFTYRLALSATIERFRDEEGTEALLSFFGEKCIEYTLERAIAEDKLTPYKYYPVVVHLNEKELSDYEQLSYEISKCLIKDKHGNSKLNKYGEILAIKRSRIVAGAQEKLAAIREEILPYKNDYNILVYCGATNVHLDEQYNSRIDESELRQIEAVIDILGNDLNMKVSKFTSQENIDERTLIREHFETGNELQAIIAIKCLDEGVNIPGIKTVFILASTTNPKEYIQRRGRVLRKSADKTFAEIYDFVTLPRPLDSVSSLTKEQAKRDETLIRNELSRIKEFSSLALNKMGSNQLIWSIEEAYHLN